MQYLTKVFTNQVREVKEEVLATQAEQINQLIFNAKNSVAETSAKFNVFSNTHDLAYCLAVAEQWFKSELFSGEPLCSPESASSYLRSKMRDLPHEVFSIILMDNQNRAIHYEELFRGTINAASIYPREVVKLALKHNAAAVILAHNHPSGSPTPSQSDISLTQRIISALEIVDVRVLDHLVIGDSITSFTKAGLI